MKIKKYYCKSIVIYIIIILLLFSGCFENEQKLIKELLTYYDNQRNILREGHN